MFDYTKLGVLVTKGANVLEAVHTWNGGGVGMGFSQHSGTVIVCDGTEEADRRLGRVLFNDPATGVMRHADAGYSEAIECAKNKNLKLPMVGD